MKACLKCKRGFRPPGTPWVAAPTTVLQRGRGLCRVCHNRYRDDYPTIPPPQPFLTVLDEIDWLLEQGETPAAIPARLGRKRASLARQAYRAGRRDLGRVFGRVAP